VQFDVWKGNSCIVYPEKQREGTEKAKENVDYPQDAQNYSRFGGVNPKKKDMEFVIVGVIIGTIIVFIRFIIKKVFD
jgi:hypothetical protein